MDQILIQKIAGTQELFDAWFLDARKVYLHFYERIPHINNIDGIEGEKLYNSIKVEFKNMILREFSYRDYEISIRKYEFGKTLMLLKNNCLLVMDDTYVVIYHDGMHMHFVEMITKAAYSFKGRKKRRPLEINLLIQGREGLQLKPMELKRTKLDIGLYYEDDFCQVDETIRRRLNAKKDKGIVLLHGLPGTGKTSYLRYLVGRLKKRVLFLSPNVAANLMSPSFIEVLISNPETVLVIEDAENIIMDRKSSSDSSVSNLLNISDGLLADCLNVQIICTFNSALTLIDEALLRKGRLIARYEFGKLSVEKAQRLSDHLGYDRNVLEPMTVAEITFQNDPLALARQVRTIGFRQ